MRHISLVLVVVLLMVVGSVAAHAAIGIGATLPLYSVDHTDAMAGGNYLINFDSEAGATEHHEAWYIDGALKVFTDKYGIFDALKYMSVDYGVLRIEEKHLKAVESDIKDGKLCLQENGVLQLNDGRIIVCRDQLGTGQYVVVTNIKHDQSTKNSHGLLASLGQLVGIKKTRHIMKTDVVAMRFEITDASSTIERVCRLQFKTTPDKLDDDQRYILRSAFYEEGMRDRIGFADYPGLLDMVTQGYAAMVQGFDPPLAKERGPSQEIVELQRIIADLQEQIRDIINTQVEEKRAVQAAQAAAKEASQLKNWVLKAGRSSTGAWALWLHKDGETVGPQYIASDVIVVRGGPGVYYAEVKPWQAGNRFESWTRYDVESVGQQLEVK